MITVRTHPLAPAPPKVGEPAMPTLATKPVHYQELAVAMPYSDDLPLSARNTLAAQHLPLPKATRPYGATPPTPSTHRPPVHAWQALGIQFVCTIICAGSNSSTQKPVADRNDTENST